MVLQIRSCVQPESTKKGDVRKFEEIRVVVDYDVAPDGWFLMTIEPMPSITHLNLVQNWFQELERLVPTDN